MEDSLNFYAEVRVSSFPAQRELEGMLGAILGISEPSEIDTPPEYGVMLDGYGRPASFRRDQIAPTGQERKRGDYY
ncbi:hypothetical protein [Streptomyces sp. NBC_01361]|uniref:hypothetical protein n=1 Tax=Streptomyces sp. NBC_01361 TaxID=2903838 RepID=UPI002E372183|nr:hypothetical protein [Streptomyces sp. NBC_01361]